MMTRMRAICLAMWAACGGSQGPAGGDTPEAPLRELLSATTTGDAAAMRHAMLSPDRLRKAASCPDGNRLMTTLSLAVDHLDQAAELTKEAKAEIGDITLTETGLTKVAKGEAFRGCTASEPFEVRSYSIKAHVTVLGHATDLDDHGQVIQLDGRWYALVKE
jgi:hypothetical protein